MINRPRTAISTSVASCVDIACGPPRSRTSDSFQSNNACAASVRLSIDDNPCTMIRAFVAFNPCLFPNFAIKPLSKIPKDYACIGSMLGMTRTP